MANYSWAKWSELFFTVTESDIAVTTPTPFSLGWTGSFSPNIRIFFSIHCCIAIADPYFTANADPSLGMA